MNGAARQIAYRIKSEGKAEVVRDARETGQAFVAAYGQAEAAVNKAGDAADRQMARWVKQAAAARDAMTMDASRARFDQVLGVRAPTSGSARDSAAVFQANAEAMEEEERRARALKAVLDPLGAAQDRLNDELAEYERLAAAGRISTVQLSQAQAMAKARFDETALAISRQERGLSRLVVASRLNLARQGADVLTTAAMGMNPAMIAIQQGPQILDAMATSGIKASGSLLLVGGAIAAAAAGVAVLTAAWLTGEASALSYERAVTGVGRVSGLSARELEVLTIAAAEQGKVTERSAREQAAVYLSTGRIGSAVLGDLIAIGRDYASAFGLDAEQATQSLAKAMLEPDKAGRELTRTMGLLSQEQLDQIDNLIKVGDLTGAQRILLDGLTAAVSGHAAKVGEIESAWDAVARAAQNAWEWIGKALMTTRDEEIVKVEQLRDSLPSGSAARRAMEARWTELVGQRNREQAEEAARAATQSANQEAQLAADRAARARAESEREARSARAAAERAGREAERERREALARDRREEDRKAALDVEVARLRNDQDRLRVLEDEATVRTRVRELVDDGLSVEQATTRALAEQARLAEAQDDARDRALKARERQHQIELAEIRGEHGFAAQLRQRADLEERINALLADRLDLVTATHFAMSEQFEIAQAQLMARKREMIEEQHALELDLARAAGRDTTSLERRNWIEQRAREIEADRRLDRGEGKGAAEREWAQHWEAEMVGARRRWLTGFLQDIRRGGLGDALGHQLERAADRMIEKLVDQLMDIDFARLLGGGKGGGFDFGSLVMSLFGSGPKVSTGNLDALKAGIGRNAAGTDFWTGGLTWVGERGKELIDLPRGSKVVEHTRSLQMAAASGGKGGSGGPTQFIFSPVVHAEGAGPREVDAIRQELRALAESLPARVPQIVRDAQSRRILRSDL